MAVRVMVVDDHAVFREGLRRLLEVGGEFEVVAEASTAGEGVERLKACSPHIVLMDVGLPDRDGIEAIREVGRVAPEVSVIVLTMYADDRLAADALRAGAAAYLVKTATYEEVLRALHAVREGGGVVSPQVARQVFTRLACEPRAGASAPALSEREREVLRRVCEGQSNREIARGMYLSESSVKACLKQVYRKLGARNRAEAASKGAGVLGPAQSDSRNVSF